MNVIFNKIFDDLFFLYNTSFSHSFNKSKGWEIRFQANKFLKRIRKYALQRIISKNDELIITQNVHKRFLRNRPRIVHIIGKIGGIGGSQKIIFDLMSNLIYKYDMEIITLSRQMIFDYPGIKVHCCDRPQDLKNYLLENIPDIVHLHYYGDWYGFHDALKVVLEMPNNVGIIENINTPIQMYMHARINEYIHVSRAVYDLQKVRKGKIIYPGVDTDEYRPSKKMGHPKTGGFVYRLFKDKINEKSFEMLIEIARKDKEIKIIVVGYGANFGTYFDLIKRSGVRNQFEFLGDVQYKQLADIYKQFSVFLAAVHTESYGLVVPYAMSMNIPVVAMRVGALPELLGKTNFLCDNADEFINAAVKVLNNIEIPSSKYKENRRRAIARFSLKNMLQQYDETYREVIKNK